MNSESCRILIFGGTGFLGKYLIKYYHNLTNSTIGVFSRDEAKHIEIISKYSESRVKSFIGDIRDYQAVDKVLNTFRPTHIIVASAMKNIVFAEQHPVEAVKTNIIGLENLLNSNYVRQSFVQIVFVSTDKASGPINVYGMTKAICEQICVSSNITTCIVRYGNVLNSTGSIIPIIKNSIKNHNRMPALTHKDMTRFVMKPLEAVQLIDFALTQGRKYPYHIIVPRLKSMKLIDLFDIYSEKYNINYDISVPRPGEKLHESLITKDESSQYNIDEVHYGRYLAINKKLKPDNSYNYEMHSNNPNSLISKEELKDILASENLL